MENKYVKLHTEDLRNVDRDSIEKLNVFLITQATYCMSIFSNGFPFAFRRMTRHHQ